MIFYGSSPGRMLGVEWSSRRQLGGWRERRAVADAVLDGRDPGEEHRAAVDRIARKQVATRIVDAVLALVVVGGLGVACLVTAVVRGDSSLVWPGIALLACAALLVVTGRRATRRARAWLSSYGGAAP